MDMDHNFSLIALMGVLGACLGSFANVAALRTLRGEDWVKQPSSCFACGRPLGAFDNLPILGYFRYGGVSGCCQKPLPKRYLYVELAMAALTVLAFLQLPLLMFLSFMPFVVLMSVIFLTDMEAFIIPDWTSLGGLALGLVLALLGAPGLPDIVPALTGAGAGFALIYGINAVYKLWRGHDGLGFGDVKMMAMLGAWLGPLSLLPILFTASICGAVLGISAILWAKLVAKTDAPVQLPFGCFLAPAALLWLFFAPHLLRGL